MKKFFALLLALVCLLSLCACGKDEAKLVPVTEQTPASAPVETPTQQSTETPEAPVEEPVNEPAPTVSLFDTAKALEGESVEDLLSAIGEPVSKEDYAPSCLGDGEDGLWHYEGFDVYTYRENGNESVYAVMQG